jgi:hypothetical protein
MINQFNSTGMIPIHQVSEMMSFKSINTTMKWLEINGVKIHRVSNKKYVFEIDILSEIDKLQVKELKKRYPEKWIEMYRTIATNPKVCELVLLQIGDEPIQNSKYTMVKVKNKKEEELLKQLLSCKN